ncbi:DUF934 domain-containing protein [uncultured Oceanicoccus sp.]|uniref:DUF934 domain-containing protein n=1 Tax=uncultured Oceanicoccus sp. TaxID=1706381 RepID=UPI0030D6FEBA
MPNKIIKDGAVVEDQWQVLDTEATEVPEGAVIVPLSLWTQQKDALAQRDQLGIWLNSDESPQLIADSLANFAVIAINFPAFADGRGFTYGRELREQHQYQGEIRAIGEFIRDQLFFLKRCGFNAFALDGVDLNKALDSFADFSDAYQAAIDQPEPLFKRR